MFLDLFPGFPHVVFLVKHNDLIGVRCLVHDAVFHLWPAHQGERPRAELDHGGALAEAESLRSPPGQGADIQDL